MIQVGTGGKTRFIFDHSSDEQVFLVGDFNNWNENTHPLNQVDGHWEIDMELPPGEYEFKYLAGKIWYNDYAAHKYVENPWGDENSVVVVK